MKRCAYCEGSAWFMDRSTGELLCPLHSRLEVGANPSGEGKTKRSSRLAIRLARPADREAVLAIWEHFWDEDEMDCFGRLYRAAEIPALLACDGEQVMGVLSYAVELDRGAANMVALNVMPGYQGLGAAGALLAALEAVARRAGLERLIVATSNDNLPALMFYQRAGFEITGVEVGAIEPDRPGEPHLGVGGIPVRDEIQLEKRL